MRLQHCHSLAELRKHGSCLQSSKPTADDNSMFDVGEFTYHLINVGPRADAMNANQIVSRADQPSGASPVAQTSVPYAIVRRS